MQDLIDSRVLNMIKQKICYTCVILKHSVSKYLYFLRSLEMEMDDRDSIHFANVKNRLTVSSVLLFLFVDPPISLLIIFSPSSTLSCFSSLLDLHFLQRMWVWCDETWCFDTTGNPSRGTRFVLASVQRRTVHLSKVTLKLRMDCVSQRKFSAAKSLWKWVGVCVCVCVCVCVWVGGLRILTCVEINTEHITHPLAFVQWKHDTDSHKQCFKYGLFLTYFTLKSRMITA